MFDRISGKKRKECFEKTAEKVAEDGGLNGSQKRVLDYISENGGAKVKDMSTILSIPIDTLDKIVSYLIKILDAGQIPELMKRLNADRIVKDS
ncbi:MAG: helix-turn-helix domain-containing protein [Paludibacteraceae bacterium]